MSEALYPKHPDEPMTGRQSWALFCITGIDVRDTNLTQGEAHHLIDRFDGGEDIRDEVLAFDGAKDSRRRRSQRAEPVQEKAPTAVTTVVTPKTDEVPTVEGVVQARPDNGIRTVKPDRPHKGAATLRLTIPAAVAKFVDAEAEYQPCITTEGILFRQVK